MSLSENVEESDELNQNILCLYVLSKGPNSSLASNVKGKIELNPNIMCAYRLLIRAYRVFYLVTF